MGSASAKHAGATGSLEPMRLFDGSKKLRRDLRERYQSLLTSHLSLLTRQATRQWLTLDWPRSNS